MLSYPLRWHGGNDYLKQWLWSFAPYCVNEYRRWGYTHRATAFYGGGQEEWDWPNGELAPGEGISETINDLNPLLSNFFRCLRSHGPEMMRRLTLMPFSQHEYDAAVKRLEYYSRRTSVERIGCALDFFVVHRMSRQGMGKCYATPTRRIRRGMNEQVSAYLSAVDGLPEIVERLRGVEIRNEHFRAFIPRYDHGRCLHFLDPPYLHYDIDGREIRKVLDAYAFEMTLDEHVELLEILTNLQGKFMLQGYPSKLYASYAKRHGWRCFRKKVVCQSSAKKVKESRTECLWTNYDPPSR